MTKNLRTARTVIAALGGTPKVAALTGAKYSRAFNWLSKGYFPSWTYLLITKALAERGLTASPSLWPGMERPADQPSTRHGHA
jgi:hypothetical protein